MLLTLTMTSMGRYITYVQNVKHYNFWRIFTFYSSYFFDGVFTVCLPVVSCLCLLTTVYQL